MAILRDLKNNLDLVQSLAPAARKVSANGAGANLQGYGAAMAIVSIGAYTNGDFTFKLQESNDDGDTDPYADVAAGDQEGSFTEVKDSTGQNAIQRVGYKGAKQYIRVVLTENSGSPAPATGALIGASILRGHPTQAPLA